MKQLINKLARQTHLSRDEFTQLLTNITPQLSEHLYALARQVANQYYSNEVYTRGLIEFTNHCRNDCYYCGIRKSNLEVQRYRLSKTEIMECCETGYDLGFRTFVLQGGEDLYYNDELLVSIITDIKHTYPDCALTLSIGERSYDQFKKYKEAGADRYLLRHETANEEHYRSLHPSDLSLSKRKQCLFDLKELGYQVGTGIMIGSPNQTIDHLVEDLLFIKELAPQMVGIGPFIPHHATPFHDQTQGSLEMTLFFLGLLRLMLPNALIPASTALGTIDKQGRELGVLAGANVVMPNLSPIQYRKQYELYDNKICTGDEAAECRVCLANRMTSIGYQLAVSRGDHRAIPLPVKPFGIHLNR